MLSKYLRKLIHQELKDMRRDMAEHLADLVARNNEKIEEDLIDLGLLERDKNGQLHLKARSLRWQPIPPSFCPEAAQGFAARPADLVQKHG